MCHHCIVPLLIMYGILHLVAKSFPLLQTTTVPLFFPHRHRRRRRQSAFLLPPLSCLDPLQYCTRRRRKTPRRERERARDKKLGNLVSAEERRGSRGIFPPPPSELQERQEIYPVGQGEEGRPKKKEKESVLPTPSPHRLRHGRREGGRVEAAEGKKGTGGGGVRRNISVWLHPGDIKGNPLPHPPSLAISHFHPRREEARRAQLSESGRHKSGHIAAAAARGDMEALLTEPPFSSSVSLSSLALTMRTHTGKGEEGRKEGRRYISAARLPSTHF